MRQRPMNRDFSGMKLETTDFRGLDLRGANFRGTTFGSNVRFWNADLRGADFSHSRGADEFRGADLTGANFTGAQDVGSFYGVGRNSPPAILNGTKFAGVRMDPVNFKIRPDDMARADFSVADLEGAIFDCRSWERQPYIALLRDIKSRTPAIVVEGSCLQ